MSTLQPRLEPARDSVPGDSASALAVVRAATAFPVKGADAGPADYIVLDRDGVVGDRRFTVQDGSGAVLTADRAPTLRAVRAWLDDAGRVRVDVPAGPPGAVGAEADLALTQFLGRTVSLVAVPAGSQLEAPVHLVSIQGVEAARRGEHEAADCACSVEEPRANLVLEVAPGQPPERAWVGRTIGAGTAVLRVHRRPGHCLGVYAEVVAPGRIAVGDTLRAVEG